MIDTKWSIMHKTLELQLLFVNLLNLVFKLANFFSHLVFTKLLIKHGESEEQNFFAHALKFPSPSLKGL